METIEVGITATLFGSGGMLALGFAVSVARWAWQKHRTSR